MRIILIILLCCAANNSLFAQPRAMHNRGPAPSDQPNVYAIVVGISSYQDKDIPQLRYADRDATVFAEFLRSKAGGTVPPENITLLVDSAATTAAVYDAIYNLSQSCKSGDLVYFYFSGHGDLENATIYKNGFLICYDSPPNNYVRLSLSIDYLNDIANTLSAKTNANVVLITDACHSGKLAGSRFKGNFLAGNQLRAVRNKEIRITSCAPDQVSNENRFWGGGRGVFSYYLVNGLKGLADRQKDGFVTVDEIRHFLDSSLAGDRELKRDNIVQTPVLKGNGDFQLAKVDPAVEKETELEMANSQPMPVVMMSKSAPTEDIPADPQQYFFYLLKKQSLEQLTTNLSLDQLNENEIPFTIINWLKGDFVIKRRIPDLSNDPAARLQFLIDSLSDKPAKVKIASRGDFSLITAGPTEVFTDYQASQDLLPGRNGYQNKGEDSLAAVNRRNKLTELEAVLQKNQKLLRKFNGKLAVAFDNIGQRVIDQYLKGDEAEMERRRYYNFKKSGYDVYPKMFSVALKLSQPDSYLHNNLEVKLQYFSGVALRLAIPGAEDPKPLLAKALNFQQKALTLETHAPYIYNELGVLYTATNRIKEAEDNFRLAIANAPTWVIPQANLIGLYTRKNDFEKAMEAYQAALELQPDFQGLNVNAGLLYEMKGNLLMAEEFQRKSIHQNSRHYLPFERLGYVYLNTTQYALADSFFYEADLRKQGFHFVEPLWWLNPLDYAYDEIKYCKIDSNAVSKDDAIGQTVLGFHAMEKDAARAEKYLRKAIAIDPGNPIAFHYLGKLLFRQKKWQEAEIIFKYAVTNYLDSPRFKAYNDTLDKHYKNPEFRKCILSEFRRAWYNRKDDHFIMGTLYESWSHLSEAAGEFNTVITLDPTGVEGYVKLWSIWEKMGRYTEAENTIQQFRKRSDTAGRNELYAFYKRMIRRFPDDGQWYYKEGNLLYSLAAAASADEAYSIELLKEKESKKEPEFTEPDISTDVPVRQDPNFIIYLKDTKDSVILSHNIKTPYSEEGIAFLKAADSLLNADEGTHAGINDHIGDMFTWLGLQYQASHYFRVSVDAMPANASVREKLVDSYAASYQLQNALAQLDSLANRHEINFTKQLMMARYLIHSGRFTEAQLLLNNAEKNHPYTVPAIIDLNGRLQLLAKNPAVAIKYYQQLIAINPKDSMAMYSLAKLNTRLGKQSEAWKWLNAALASGFDYAFILNNDPDIKSLRSSDKWHKLLDRFDIAYIQNKMIEKKADRIKIH